MTKRVITSRANKIKALGSSYTYLLKYAYLNKIPLDSNGPRFAYIENSGNDSLLVMAGFPITKRIQAKDGVECLTMPQNGRMLVGIYNGPYWNLGKLYTAMDQYIRLRHLQKVPALYEKFLSNPTTAKDSLDMKIEVHQAIF
jgi:hypothetical protein